MLNPTGVISATRTGTMIGAASGAIGGGTTTKLVNPDASMNEIANNALKGAINGATTSLVMSPLGYISGTSIPAQSAIAILGLHYDMIGSAIATQYDFFQDQALETRGNE